MVRSDDAAFSFTLATTLAGLTPKALRGWLDRGQVDYGSDRAAGGWRMFTMAEILQLAIIGEIVRYGYGVPYAASIVENTVGRKLSTSGAISPRTMETLREPIFLRRSMDGGDIQFSSDDYSDDLPSAVIIRPLAVLGEVMHRANKLGKAQRESMIAEDVLAMLAKQKKKESV